MSRALTLKLPWPPSVNHYWLILRRRRLVTVSGATHMVSLVKPDRFTQLLLDGYAEAGRITG